MAFRKHLGGRLDTLVEEMKEKRHTMTPRLTAYVTGSRLVPLLAIEDLGERNAVYCRKEATGARSLMKGWGLTLITYSVFLILIFNKEDIGKHIALITIITKRNTDYIKKLSLSKLLPAAFICFESTESLSHLQKPSLCHWVTFLSLHRSVIL